MKLNQFTPLNLRAGGLALALSALVSLAQAANQESELAKKIAATVTQKGETLLAKVRSREDRIADLKESLKERRPGAVSVNIRERHFGQPVIDPAAETELGLILEKCGFKLVDDRPGVGPTRR